MRKKKNHKSPNVMVTELKKDPIKYDVKTSMFELVKMFDILRIKFDNHIELAKKENKVSTSLTGLHQQFLKLFNSIEKLNV